MFRKQDFKKLDLLGSGKKHTKIYKVQHLQTNKIYALKEIEAKTLDKLNEYKEEAVQLSKVQNFGNVIKFYGYYFAETMYNTFRLGIITEYMDHNTNLENLYRKKKKANQTWKEAELVQMLFSLISTCSYLQQKGICHRDIKPANLFVLPNGELKMIDFGESKDYFYDPNDESKNTYTMATIRGTPQYLSPILWKAHVVDGNSRYVEHNIYKSDVFSSGLVIYQMAAMQEVTGFNNKTPQNDGEQLIKQSLIQLEKHYGNQFINVIALMLIFEESNRPSFVEVEQLFIEHETQGKQSKLLSARESLSNPDPQQRIKMNDYIMLYNMHFNTILKKGPAFRGPNDPDDGFKQVLTQVQKGTFNHATALQSMSNTQDLPINSHLQSKGSTSVVFNAYPAIDSAKDFSSSNHHNNIIKDQTELVSKQRSKEANFYKDSTLILNNSCYFFEFGGSQVCKFSTTKMKWKQILKLDQALGLHFTVIFVPELKGHFLVGGIQGSNFKFFKDNKLILLKTQMPNNRSFASCVFYNHKIYVFGGYDQQTKTQLGSCLSYDIHTEKWHQLAELRQLRSQACACRVNDAEILIFGGYNKVSGTLDTIERYTIAENKWDTLSLTLPLPLRRFMVVRLKKNLALILGGLTLSGRESQRVFRLDWDKRQITECEPLEKGGIIESEVLVDNEGCLHIFLENANGTSPHSHIKYLFDPDATQYITKND